MTQRKTPDGRAAAATEHDPLLGPPNKASLASDAFRAIRKSILDCDLEPGTMMSGHELASRFSYGLAPIRTSMEHLIAHGFVESVPQRGYRVLPITIKDVLNMYAVVELVSPRLTRLSAGRIGPDYERLMVLNAASHALRAPSTPQEEEDILATHLEILIAIREASSNPYASFVTEHLAMHINRALAARRKAGGHPIDVRRDFSGLLNALNDNDPERAEAESAAAIKRRKEVVLTALLESPAVWQSPIHASDAPAGQIRTGRMS
jgi:DNA-binding GntR family transcriptional regulator